MRPNMLDNYSFYVDPVGSNAPLFSRDILETGSTSLRKL
jgi:hypothetical protein